MEYDRGQPDTGGALGAEGEAGELAATPGVHSVRLGKKMPHNRTARQAASSIKHSLRKRSFGNDSSLASGTLSFAEPATEALVAEQLETFRRLLETNNANLFESISKLFQVFQQQVVAQEISRLYTTSVNGNGEEVLECHEVTRAKLAGVAATMAAMTPPLHTECHQPQECPYMASSGIPLDGLVAANVLEPSPPAPPNPNMMCVASSGKAVKFVESGLSTASSHAHSSKSTKSRPSKKGRIDMKDEIKAMNSDAVAKQLRDKAGYVPPSAPKQRQVFPDEGKMKQKIRDQIAKGEYKVENFYHKEGCARRIATSPIFDSVTLSVIAFNALWMSVEVDNNNATCLAQADLGFQIIENLFCLYFFGEWAIRFAAFKRKRDSVRDVWFVFDSVLVALMVCETWIIFTINLIVPSTQPNAESGDVGNATVLRLIRLLRLLRATRLVRLLRGSPELLVLVKGIISAIRSVFFTFFLMIMVAYVYAIAFTQLTAGTEVGDEYFNSVPMSMKNLLVFACFPDLGDIINEVGDYDMLLGFAFLVFILLISLTILNMLVGVLCEVTRVVSAVEKETLMVDFVKEEITMMLELVDTDEDKLISHSEFKSLLLQEKAVKFLTHVGVDVVALVDFVDVFYKGGKTFEFPEIITMILQLRGTNICTVKDVVDLRKWIDNELLEIMKDLHRSISSIHDEMLVEKRKSGEAIY